MKKAFLILSFLLVAGFAVQAQKFAYVNTEYILSNVPDYEEAQKKIEETGAKWQKEVEEKFTEVASLYKKFQTEAPLLTQDMKVKRENEIVLKEREANEMQRKRFGNDGDLFKLRQEMIQPIQDKVYEAIEKRAQAKNFVFVFDRADNIGILYADPKVDLSNEVLNEMGYNVKKKIKVDASIEQKTSEKNIKIGG